MAAYFCPKILQPPMPEMMADAPCAGIDDPKPVHCAEHQAGEKQALEYLATAPTLTPIVASFIIPVIASVIPSILASPWTDIPLESAATPPYLRTQRLRI